MMWLVVTQTAGHKMAAPTPVFETFFFKGGGEEKLKWSTAVHAFFIPFLLIQPVMFLQLSSPLKNRCRQYLAPREHMAHVTSPCAPNCSSMDVTKSVKILTPMSLLKLTWGWGSFTDPTQRAEKWIFYVIFPCAHPCMQQNPWRFLHPSCF